MDEDGFAKLSYWSFVVYLGTLVQDGLAHMRGVTWRAVPAKFKTGMFEMNIIGSEVCGVSFWNVGSGLAHMHGVIWKAAPAKFKRDVRDENLGSEVLWCIFGTLVQDGLEHMRGVICSGLFRQNSKQGCVRCHFRI